MSGVPLFQRIRGFHHKQLGLFWNPLCPKVIGVAWRSTAFPAAVDSALASVRLVDVPPPAPVAVDKKSKGKKQKAAAVAAAVGPWSTAAALPAGGVEENVAATASQLLTVAESMLTTGAGLVLDVTL